jgi:putative FmdB family regulatory protein
MPIYGYRCTECGHELEVFQSMSAEPLKVCSECGGALRKRLYPVGVQFKGSGFYTTDYRNNNDSSSGGGQKSKSEEGGSSSDSKSSSGSGTDSKSSSSESNGSSSSTPEKKSEPAASKE